MITTVGTCVLNPSRVHANLRVHAERVGISMQGIHRGSRACCAETILKASSFDGAMNMGPTSNCDRLPCSSRPSLKVYAYFSAEMTTVYTVATFGCLQPHRQRMPDQTFNHELQRAKPTRGGSSRGPGMALFPAYRGL